MLRPPIFFVLLAGCQEYNLKGEERAPEAPIPQDTEAPPLDSEPMDSEPFQDRDPPVEECNGKDDDGDGLVDEGFGDVDGDGIADCIDDECEVEVPDGYDVKKVEACAGETAPAVKDPWNVGIEWQYSSAGQGVIVMPAVGNLTDDDGDGDVDENDSPDIAFTVWSANTLVALHGDGSGVIFEVSGYNANAGVTIADVDMDGEPEVVALNSSYQVAAVDATGAAKWTSSSFSSLLGYYPQPAVADLDADGDVEVIMDRAVVAGADGATLFTLSNVSASWITPVAADIDADGTQEIILGEDVFSHAGALEWSSSNSGQGNFAAVADIDGDAGGEVFFLTGSNMYIHDDNGTLLTSATIPGSNPGPPSVADFDGDGVVEIGFPANSAISVWETNGTMNWSAPISDNSGLAGCSGYDVDGDGAYELLYADEGTFYMYDGASGSVLYQDSTHSSGTLWEYPVTADVDGDGSAEIVIASNTGTWNGITVFGHNGNGWAPSGPTWGTHDFAVTNLNPDGSVPSPAPTPWSVYNVFRARPMVDDMASPDLYPVFGDVCVASCDDGPIKVTYAVGNQGVVDVEAGVEFALYTVNKGVEELVSVHTLDALPAGQVVPGNVYYIDLDDWGDGAILSVDDDGTGRDAVWECDEDNNQVEYTESFCGT